MIPITNMCINKISSLGAFTCVNHIVCYNIATLQTDKPDKRAMRNTSTKITIWNLCMWNVEYSIWSSLWKSIKWVINSTLNYWTIQLHKFEFHINRPILIPVVCQSHMWITYVNHIFKIWHVRHHGVAYVLFDNRSLVICCMNIVNRPDIASFQIFYRSLVGKMWEQCEIDACAPAACDKKLISPCLSATWLRLVCNNVTVM